MYSLAIAPKAATMTRMVLVTIQITPFGNAGDNDDDGVPDELDAFPLDATESIDTDGDGIGNNADDDDDGDGAVDGIDAFPLDAAESLDTDGDGIGNNADQDDDADGVGDASDVFPLDPNESVDYDGDGIGDNSDQDVDGDGYDDFIATPYTLFDAGKNSVCGTNDGGLWCASIGSTSSDSLLEQVPAVYGSHLAVGSDRACISVDGGISCWGAADGAPVPDLPSPTSMSGYAQHFCAVDNDTAHCWGKDVSVTEKPGIVYVAG